MTGLVRTAHSGLGKLLELLWWNREGRFTDVGCTLRAFWRSTYRDMESSLRATGPEVLAEMVHRGYGLSPASAGDSGQLF